VRYKFIYLCFEIRRDTDLDGFVEEFGRFELG